MWFVELLQHIAVVVASIAAVYALTTWKREFKGKRDMELAEETLCLFYRAQRAIEAIRWPMYDLSEARNREVQADETPEQKEARDRANVVFKKIQDHSDVFEQLYALRFRFMARFGRDKAQPFDDLKRIVDTIWVCTQALAELWTKKLQGKPLREDDVKDIKEYERVIRYSGKDDPTVQQLQNITEQIEGICRPILEGRRLRAGSSR